ncbi:MAG: hypothetical protein ACR2OA_14450 [Rubripirellula sp.]
MKRRHPVALTRRNDNGPNQSVPVAIHVRKQDKVTNAEGNTRNLHVSAR